MKTFLLCALSLLGLASCQKIVGELTNPLSSAPTPPVTDSTITYVIKQGKHECEQSTYKALSLNELKFTVQFDSSAVYQTAIAENQYDINKLYGFADNNAFHQQYSARFGWGWSDNALHLYSYTYNNSVRASEDLGTLPIGAVATCSIKVTDSSYIFSVNDKEKMMPRLSTTPLAEGYQLYPYFGGDETAPHEVRIRIKNL